MYFFFLILFERSIDNSFAYCVALFQRVHVTRRGETFKSGKEIFASLIELAREVTTNEIVKITLRIFLMRYPDFMIEKFSWS